MLSTWSRAASAHACGRRACAHATATGTPMRRAATALSRPRTPRFGDGSTAFYTTACGSSTALGSRCKNAQQMTLRTALRGTAAIRSDGLGLLRCLSSLSASKQDAGQRPPLAFQRLSPEMWPRPLGKDAVEVLSSICKMDDALIRHADSRPAFEEFVRTMHKTYDPEERLGDANFKTLGPDFDILAGCIKEESQQGGILHREPLTNQQFERYHGMMNRLVDSLIIQSYYDETPNDRESARKSLESLDSAWTAIRMLRSEGYPRYNHPKLDQEKAAEGRTSLTEMLQSLFDSWDKFTRPKYQVAKICYNLLVCPVPPSIHHYNALILGFTRKRMYNLSDIVIESLLYDSRLRPTPQTVACLLLHYRHKDDLLGFYGVIRRMMALDNRGMLIRRRWSEHVVQIPDLRKWAKLPEVTTSVKGNWVIEMPTRNRIIYETLVSGLLHFSRVKDAVKVFVASLQDKWGISVELFIQLLRQVIYTLDAPAADILIRGFVENASVMNALVLRANCPKKLAEHLYPLLNVGKPPSWPFSEERARLVWNSKTLATTAEDRTSIRRLTVAMFIRQTETHLMRLRHIMSRLRRITHIGLTPRTMISYAQMGMSELLAVSLHNRQLAATLLKHQTLLKAATKLEEKTWDVLAGLNSQLFRRVVLALEYAIPKPAGPDVWARYKHEEEITLLATQWMRYRLSKLHGIRSEVQRALLDFELRLMLARRLQGAARRILFSYGVTSLRPLRKKKSSIIANWEHFPSLEDEIGAEEMEDDAREWEAELEEDLPTSLPSPAVSTA